MKITPETGMSSFSKEQIHAVALIMARRCEDAGKPFSGTILPVASSSKEALQFQLECLFGYARAAGVSTDITEKDGFLMPSDEQQLDHDEPMKIDIDLDDSLQESPQTGKTSTEADEKLKDHVAELESKFHQLIKLLEEKDQELAQANDKRDQAENIVKVLSQQSDALVARSEELAARVNKLEGGLSAVKEAGKETGAESRREEKATATQNTAKKPHLTPAQQLTRTVVGLAAVAGLIWFAVWLTNRSPAINGDATSQPTQAKDYLELDLE